MNIDMKIPMPSRFVPGFTLVLKAIGCLEDGVELSSSLLKRRQPGGPVGCIFPYLRLCHFTRYVAINHGRPRISNCSQRRLTADCDPGNSSTRFEIQIYPFPYRRGTRKVQRGWQIPSRIATRISLGMEEYQRQSESGRSHVLDDVQETASPSLCCS